MTSGLRSSDGQTIPSVMSAIRGQIDKAAVDGVRAVGVRARDIVADEGHRFHIRARRTRKPIPLGAKLSKGTADLTVTGAPLGFWHIVEIGSNRTWRIERKLLGRGRNRRAQLLRTPYGPRPYVIRHGQRPTGHPFDKAMVRVKIMPNDVYGLPISQAFKAVIRG